MGSYCPICDQFVENLDNCELPYGGAPAPKLVDYSDIAFDSPPVSPRTVEANMSYNLVKTGKNMLKINNQMWEIDIDSQVTGLYRQNAMTYYQPLTHYLILARSVDNNNPLFYLVKVKNHPDTWVQIDLEKGDDIYNIQKN
jgi:hypothetical protein